MYNQGFGGFLLNNADGGNNQASTRQGSNDNVAGGRYSNASPNKQADKKKGTMIPLTIKKLLEALGKIDDTFDVDGVAVDQAIIVGRAFHVEEQSTRTIYHLDDTTGKIQIALYKRTDGSNSSGNFEYFDNMYLKAIVVVRPFKGQKMYVSNVIQPVTDYNQISYHMLSVMLAHAQRKKGTLPKQNSQGQQQQTVNPTANRIGYNQNINVQVNVNQDPMTVLKSAIIQICQDSATGSCTYQQLLHVVRGSFKENIIKNCLQKLESDAVIYSLESDDVNNPSYGILGN